MVAAAMLRAVESELQEADYASVRQATQLLSGRYRSELSLNTRLGAWAELVADVEEGLDTMWVWEFVHDLAHRDWLNEAWPLLTERVRRLRQPELDALDQRFRAATGPSKVWSMDENAVHEQGRWWQYRYPLLMTGDPSEELPATWSPAPTFIG